MPGLNFFRIDLHIHTPASKCYRYKDHTPEQIVQSAIDKGLAAIAVTDHNTGGWIDCTKVAANEKSLVIFPGVEISMSEGFHIVAIFDPSKDQKHVENFLGGIDIISNDYGEQDALCTKHTASEVIKKIHEREGLAILAHIDQPKGAFFEYMTQEEGGRIHVQVPCITLFNEAPYDAVECTLGFLPEGYDEKRFKRFPPFYQASDNPDPENQNQHSLEGIGSRYSWFNIDQIDLEGLRQCFADHPVRIFKMDWCQDINYPKIISMRVGGNGFLRNQEFTFHNGLNSIIGGKGVGKSLAVEFLRFGLQQSSNDEDLMNDLANKLEKRLEQENSIEIVYQTPEGSKYKIERTFHGIRKGENGYELETSERCLNLATDEEYLGDIPGIFPILAYSQTEVIKITENKSAQLELIDRLIDPRPYEQEIASLNEKLKANDIQLDEALQAQNRLEELTRQISTIKTKIEAINRTLDNPLFGQMKAFEAKKATLEDRQQYISDLIDQVAYWKDEISENNPDEIPQNLEEDQQATSQHELARSARLLVIQGLDGILSSLEQNRKNAEKTIQDWLPEFNQVSADYVQLLQDIGGDQEAKEKERQKLEKEKAKDEKKAKESRGLVDGLRAVWKERNQLMDQLDRAYQRLYELRRTKFEQITELSDNKLNLVLEHAANCANYEDRLVDMLKGGMIAPSVADRKQIAQNVTPRKLVEMVLDRDKRQLAALAEISETIAERAIQKFWSYEPFTEVLALQYAVYPTDVPGIHYRKEGGEYAELNELSVGQKCTALLIIALCDGTMPVVIDQPEDALDIITVWEDIAKSLRRGKNSRQFILTTHNPSVAVAADSDQFIVLRASSRNGRVVAAGAIDRPDVKKAVIDHLEGGEEPYRLRSRKYNLA
jgi:hypothetical protein